MAGQYCEGGGCGGNCKGYKARMAAQMYRDREARKDPRDPKTHTEKLYSRW